MLSFINLATNPSICSAEIRFRRKAISSPPRKTRATEQQLFFRSDFREPLNYIHDLLHLPGTTGAPQRHPEQTDSQTVALVYQFLHCNAIKTNAIRANK